MNDPTLRLNLGGHLSMRVTRDGFLATVKVNGTTADLRSILSGEFPASRRLLVSLAFERAVRQLDIVPVPALGELWESFIEATRREWTNRGMAELKEVISALD